LCLLSLLLFLAASPFQTRTSTSRASPFQPFPSSLGPRLPEHHSWTGRTVRDCVIFQMTTPTAGGRWTRAARPPPLPFAPTAAHHHVASLHPVVETDEWRTPPYLPLSLPPPTVPAGPPVSPGAAAPHHLRRRASEASNLSYPTPPDSDLRCSFTCQPAAPLPPPLTLSSDARPLPDTRADASNACLTHTRQRGRAAPSRHQLRLPSRHRTARTHPARPLRLGAVRRQRERAETNNPLLPSLVRSLDPKYPSRTPPTDPTQHTTHTHHLARTGNDDIFLPPGKKFRGNAGQARCARFAVKGLSRLRHPFGAPLRRRPPADITPPATACVPHNGTQSLCGAS